MNTLKKSLALLLAIISVCAVLSACDKNKNNYTNSSAKVEGDGYSIVYHTNIDKKLADNNSTVAQWLDKCVNDEERNDIGTYVLFYEDTSGEKNTYTYLIYRTMLELDCSVRFYMNEAEYIITAEYTPLSTSKNSTHLSMVQVIADEEPADIDLIENGDYLGVLFTKEYTNISDFIK